MGRFAIAAAALVLVSSLACRKQRSNDTAGLGDTASASAAAPAPEMPETTTPAPEFTFDRRQEFAQFIRQQLVDIDRQATELGKEVKSRGGAVSDRALARILRMRRAVERDLGRLNTATAGDWEQSRNRITQGVDQLSEAIQAAQPK